VTTLPAAAAVKEPEAIQPRRRAVLPSAWRKVELGAAFEAAAPDRAADAGLAANLAQDLSARIQTGPGVPEWTWRRVEFQWNGPVQPDQTVRWWLIPRWLERCLSTLRALLLLWLALVLVRASGRSAASRPLGAVAPPQASRPAAGGSAAVVFTTLLLVLGGPRPLSASEFPPLDLLNQLRERLLAAPPAFPGAAEIPFATLTLTNRHLVLESRIEAAATCAVPLPARFAQWSPLRVTLDGAPVAALRREDNSLWVVVSPGVHHVRLEGFLAEVDEWVWSFLLRPRRVAVQAPGWTLTGIDPEGVPQSQVFFQRVAAEPGARARTAQSTAYDQQPLVPAFEVLRELELGLRWKVRTRVRRLSPPVRAATVAVPILPGEQILTGGITPKEGRVEVNLGPGQAEFSWESELAPVEVLVLEARADDTWAEQWRLLAGPVWNVAFEELAPVYEEGRDLAPVWRPWPGEKTRLRVSRPEPIPGATLTVRSVDHVTDVGHRLRTTRLRLRVVFKPRSGLRFGTPPGGGDRVGAARREQPAATAGGPSASGPGGAGRAGNHGFMERVRTLAVPHPRVGCGIAGGGRQCPAGSTVANGSMGAWHAGTCARAGRALLGCPGVGGCDGRDPEPAQGRPVGSFRMVFAACWIDPGARVGGMVGGGLVSRGSNCGAAGIWWSSAGGWQTCFRSSWCS
jgi:hypothetical protein